MATDSQSIAWTGTDKHLNVQIGVIGKQTLDETSNQGPALAFFNGNIYLAWTGTNNQLNVISSPNGIKWGNKVTLKETSHVGPALTNAGSSLLLVWTGTNNQLNAVSLSPLRPLLDHVVLPCTRKVVLCWNQLCSYFGW